MRTVMVQDVVDLLGVTETALCRSALGRMA